jgi:hypothetical protein
MKLYAYLWLSVLCVLVAQAAVAQPATSKGLSGDSLNTAVTKLIEYYQTYENGNSELYKREKFDKAMDEMTRGGATSGDKDLAFKIVDAYIKADRNPSATASEMAGESPNAIQSTEQYKKAVQAINQAQNRLKNMSYAGFEKTSMQLNPTAGHRAIKEAYNKLHSGDGKQVAITAADDQQTPQQQMMWAVKAIENPKSYEEFAKAAKILNPKVTDEKLRKGWEKLKTK